jgi:hypothetical protein
VIDQSRQSPALNEALSQGSRKGPILQHFNFLESQFRCTEHWYVFESSLASLVSQSILAVFIRDPPSQVILYASFELIAVFKNNNIVCCSKEKFLHLAPDLACIILTVEQTNDLKHSRAQRAIRLRHCDLLVEACLSTMGNKARVRVKPFAITDIYMVIKLNNLGLGRQPALNSVIQTLQQDPQKKEFLCFEASSITSHRRDH